MNTDEDPPRLPMSSPLGGLVNEARKETLTAEHRARLWAALEAAPPPTPAPRAAQGIRFTIAKIGLACVSVPALVVATSTYRDADRDADRSPIAPSATASPSSTEPEDSAGAVDRERPPPVRSDLIVPESASAAPRPNLDTAPGGTSGAGSALPSKVTSSASALDAGTLLLEAKRAVTTAPQRALELTDEHARAFPNSKLGPESASIRIDALARLGRCEQVLAESAQFGKMFPSSPHAALVNRAQVSCSR